MGISQLFLYIPGIILFLVGSGQVRNWMHIRRADACVLASVYRCKHVVKKDKKDREVYNYYDVVVEYRNPQTKHMERLAIKSPTEYAVGQQVRMLLDKSGGTPTLLEQERESLFHPLVTMVGGALLIILALEENQGKEIPAMVCLAVIFFGAGLNLILDYLSQKKKKLQPVRAQITDIYTRQLSKGTKLLKGDKYTYYPIVHYELNGKENIRRCNINSSGKNTFQTGTFMTLYYDAGSGVVLEKHERIGAMVVGVVLAVLGVLIGASILSVLV